MKIDRLIGILSILLQQEQVTAPYLAEKFEVSKRTINRDIDALAQAGIPIATTQGVGGGISIMSGYRVDKTLLTAADMQAVLAGLKSLDSVAGTNRYKQLMEKFSAGSSDILSSNSHILINLCSWHKQTLTPKIELIQKAIDTSKLIEFCYYSPGGESVRKMEPYLLIFQWSSWYVWGYCMLRADFRMFKLNRIDKLKLMEEQFQKRETPCYDMANAATCYGSYDDFSNVEIKAAFTEKMKWRIIEEYGVNSYDTLPDNRLLLTFHWSDKESLFSWLLSFRGEVELLEPVELRTEFLSVLREIWNKYER